MNYFEEQYFIAGNTYDNYVFFGCDDTFLDKANKSLRAKGGKIPSVCLGFSRLDSDLLTPFFKSFKDDSKRMIIARTYIDTRIFDAFFRTLEKSGNIQIDPKYLELKKCISKGIDIFFNGDVDSFIDYYLNTPLHSNTLSSIMKGPHSFELNIFEENMDNTFMQRSINNYLGGRTPYSIKIFTNADSFCSSFDENGNLVQPVHDYHAQTQFTLSKPDSAFDK